MTEVAGEVADGWLAHTFTTPRYLREVTHAGAAPGPREVRPRRVARVDVSLPAFVAVGTSQTELDAAIRATKKQIAFYGSTPGLRERARAARLGRSWPTS